MTVQITINGQNLEVPQGTTILDAAARIGCEIPTLCRDKEHDRPFTSCYICLAQIEGMGRMVPACGTSVRDGMVIEVDSDAVREARRTGLELLLSDHNADCKAPCHKMCPAHADVQGYVGAIAAEDFETSMQILRKKIPLPGTLGRVCPHPCEEDCRRQEVEAPISIRNLKRWVADWEMKHGVVLPEMAPPSGKRVAIVGGGPAGLTAAYYLRIKGHGSVIYDQMPQLGGMLRYGIPEYRLPKKVLDWEIQAITDMGEIEARTNQALGRDFTISQLEKEYDAVILAIGAWKAKGLRVDGEEHPRVFGGIDYLREVVLGNEPDLGRKVVVVGGGNTAIDAARTALRQGCDVTLVYRRTRKEMPAEAEEIRDAEDEGVRYDFLVAPIGLKIDGEQLLGMTCQRMELGEPDDSGRRRPVPIEGSEFMYECDSIIKAIGQDVEHGVISADEIDQTRWDTINVARPTFRTNREKVFAAGDLVTGPQLVVDAVYMGRKAAEGIDRFFAGTLEEPDFDIVSERAAGPEPLLEGKEERVRKEPVFLEPVERIKSHAEVDTGFETPAAVEEASRCLTCGCEDVFECKLKRYMDEYEVNPRRYAGATHEYAVDLSHPNVRRDPNKCVKCGKCVEVCDAGRGLSIMGFTARGFEANVGPVLDQPMIETACEACGDCIAVCPVGALTEIVPLTKPGPYETEPVASTCAGCSLGCDVGVHAIANAITRVTPRDDGWNGVHMCRKGRFEWVDANVDGIEVDRSAAVKKLAAELKGGQIVLGADCTNEEGVLAQVIAAKLGGKAAWLADSPEAVEAQNATLAAASGTVTVEDLAAAPAVVAWGADLGTDFPVAGVGLRRAILRGGEVRYVDCVDHRAGSDRELAAGDHDAIVEVLSRDGAVLVAGPEAGDLSELVRQTGCKVLALRQGPNAAGLVALELDTVDASALRDGTPTLLLGDSPVDLPRPDAFFAAQSVAKTTKLEADLLLPRTHYLDDAGTVIATDGRVCTLHPARKRPANWELLRELAGELGVEVDEEALLGEARALQV